MAISIDGKIHNAYMSVKYGDTFPKARRSRKLYSEEYGSVMVYIIDTGQPKWTEKLEVKVPIKYYIQQIIEPSDTYKRKKKRKETGLHLVK